MVTAINGSFGRTRRKTRHSIQSTASTIAVICVRGSTAEQQNTLTTQETNARRYCEMKGIKVARVFIDSGTCGKTPWKERDTTREMINFMADYDCMEGGGINPITQIVYTRLDRAFRSTADAILTLNECAKHGLKIHFCEQDIDPNTPMGMAMLQIIAVFAELETNLRLERQLETSETMRDGNMKCGINEPYGWDKVASSHRKVRAARTTHDLSVGNDTAFDLVPNWPEQDALADILLRFSQGQTDSYIANLLNQANIPTKKGKRWHNSTVFSVRSYARTANPAYWKDTPYAKGK